MASLGGIRDSCGLGCNVFGALGFVLGCALFGTGCERVDNLIRLDEAVNDKEGYAKRVESECSAGRAASCTSLGIHYAFGTYGRARDYGVAHQLLAKACAMQDPNGCYELGLLNQHGRGVAKSAPRAAELYEQACAGKVPNACRTLNQLYHNGADGIAKDESKALLYAKKACAAGSKVDCEAAQ